MRACRVAADSRRGADWLSDMAEQRGGAEAAAEATADSPGDAWVGDHGDCGAEGGAEGGVMTWQTFFVCMFELATLWTRDGSGPEQCAARAPRSLSVSVSATSSALPRQT